MTRFPYTIWYDLLEFLISVLAIAHQYHRPNYWKARNPQCLLPTAQQAKVP